LSAAEVKAGVPIRGPIKTPSSATPSIVSGSTSAIIESEPKSATELEGLALATLREIMLMSMMDSSRVAAAKEVLVRVAAEREASGANGKKQVRLAVAEARIAGGGKFAPAEPPAIYRAN